MSLVLLARDGCAEGESLAVLLDRLSVPFQRIRLDDTADGDACGFVSPTLQIAALRQAPELLVQPTDADVTAALRRHGWIDRRRLAMAAF